VIDDLVVVGSAIDDNQRAQMPAGVVRAFDARTGALRWSWDPIPIPAATSYENPAEENKAWQTGAANAWSIMSVDPQRDLIFVPTGSASPDFFGGLRPGDNKWANAVVALHAKTGKIVWGFQLVHHDLWDYDTASPPLLTTLLHHGRDVPVVIQGNKTGFLYVLNRDTGEPVFPVEERPVPQSDVPGESASPTQPFPVTPPPLAPQKISLDDAWGITPQDRETCRNWIRGLRNEGIFTPPSLQGSLAVPGNLGGMTWSGYAFDPLHSLLVINTNNLIAKVKLIPRADFWRDEVRTENGDYAPQAGTVYGMFRRFLQAPSDLPCTAPPWGMLTAVDMTEGKVRWQVPFGSMQDFGGKLPSEVFREHFLTCFISDPVGVRLRHDIGIDNIAWEMDYPHSDSMWPGAPEELGAVLADDHVPDDEINKMTYENACRWYSFNPFKHIPREKATVGALRRAAEGHDVSIKARSHHARDAADKLSSFQDQIAAASAQLT